MIKMTFEKEDGEKFEYNLPEDDSMCLAMDLEEILKEHEMISDDETLEIIDRIEAKRLHY
jgi:hypothetical protein